MDKLEAPTVHDDQVPYGKVERNMEGEPTNMIG